MIPVVIPKNRKGKQTDLHHNRLLASRHEAQETFNRACNRLLNPSAWHKLTGAGTARFKLIQAGTLLTATGLAEEGDYIRIDIPGPGPAAGRGYDWVQVSMIADNTHPEGIEESLSLELRVSVDPLQPDGDTAHFFRAGATSTFFISRMDTLVMCEYHGRNERLNNRSSIIGDTIRNTLVGLGAMAGLSEWEWSSLLRGFLQDDE